MTDRAAAQYGGLRGKEKKEKENSNSLVYTSAQFTLPQLQTARVDSAIHLKKRKLAPIILLHRRQSDTSQTGTLKYWER